MEKSPSIKSLALALKSFHAEISNIPKDATNPFFGSKYATLSAILQAIKEPMLKNNLVFTQFPMGQNGLVTILMHTETGEYMQCEYYMTPLKNDPQAQGGVLSYMRRYSLAAVMGLNLEDDNKPAPGYVSKKKEDTNKEWLESNTKDFTDALEALKNNTVTIKDLYNTWKISKQVRAELEDGVNEASAPTTSSNAVKDEKPWLDLDSAKYNVVVERLKNKTTTLSQVSQFFKLNKEVRAVLQQIIKENT